MEPEANIQIEERQGVVVVTFHAISISNSEQIASVSQQIKKTVEQETPAKLIFDFAEVKFFSSQVLGLLVEMKNLLEPKDGRVIVSSINPQLYRVFKITNLDKLFEFYPDKDSAVTGKKTDR